MVVSAIPSGAGSVDVSARPIFPKTLRTSGTVLICASIARSTALASAIDIPGGAVGMCRSVPSWSGGMNSDSSASGRGRSGGRRAWHRDDEPAPPNDEPHHGLVRTDEPAVEWVPVLPHERSAQEHTRAPASASLRGARENAIDQVFV
jgi:hypothetical protein